MLRSSPAVKAAIAFSAALCLSGCGHGWPTKSAPDAPAAVLAAQAVKRPAAPDYLTELCTPPSPRIAGKDYRQLYKTALAWGGCADRKQRDWIAYDSSLRRGPRK